MKTVLAARRSMLAAAIGTALAVVALSPGARARPWTPVGAAPPNGRCGAPAGDGSVQPEDFRLHDGPGHADIALPIAPGVIVEDVTRWLLVRYAGGEAAPAPESSPRAVMRRWIDALGCDGWRLASQAASAREAQAWLTHPDRAEVAILSAHSAGGIVELEVMRRARLEPPSPAWLPPSLASPPLAPLASELRRHETAETTFGRQVLHVAYPLETTASAVERAWTRALTTRGWSSNVVAGRRYFAGPDGTVALEVWRGLGAVELNLHRVTDEEPERARWSSAALPLLGVPHAYGADATELETILRCSEVAAAASAASADLRAYDSALAGMGWRRSSGPSTRGRAMSAPTPPTTTLVTAVYRRRDVRLVVTLDGSPDQFCRKAHLLLRPIVAKSALGPAWSGDDWHAMAGKAGAIIAVTQGGEGVNASLTIDYRSELLGLGPPQVELCPALERRLHDDWSAALGRRGWQLSHPPSEAHFARGDDTLDLEVACIDGAVTVTLMR